VQGAGLCLGGAVVLVVGDVLAPGGGRGRVVPVLQHGDVLHEATGCGSVPVFFTGRGIQGLAGVNFDDGAVAATEPGDALGDAEVLSARVRMQGGACATAFSGVSFARRVARNQRISLRLSMPTTLGPHSALGEYSPLTGPPMRR